LGGADISGVIRGSFVSDRPQYWRVMAMDYDPKCGIIASTLEALVFLALVFTLLVQSLSLLVLGGIPMGSIQLERRTK
jgi:hypothetical protein